MTNDARHRIILTKILPMTYYGVQSAPIPGKMHRALRSGIKRALVFGSAGFGNPTLAGLSWGRRNPDPDWLVLFLRVKALR
eukprot:846021-Alexandrium_andersonii.AAC.1